MADKDLQSIKYEAQRKIGRNIMIFQQVEFMLKYLISRSRIDGLASELEDVLAKREKNIHKKTLGLLAKDLFDTVYTIREPAEPPTDIDEPWLSITFHSETDQLTLDKFKSELEKLVGQRNDLIHHRLHPVDQDSRESWQELITFLDAQRENTIPIFEQLRGLGLSIYKAAKELEKVSI